MAPCTTLGSTLVRVLVAGLVSSSIGTALCTRRESVQRVFCPRATRRMVFLACQMIFDVSGDLLAGRRQRKQFGFNERIGGPVDKFPIRGPLLPYIIKPIIDTEHSTVELGGVTIHGGAFTRALNA